MSVGILATESVGRHRPPTMTGHVARLWKPQNGKTGRDTDTRYKNEIAFQSKAHHSRTEYTDEVFCSCDLDADSMILIYERDLIIPKM